MLAICRAGGVAICRQLLHALERTLVIQQLLQEIDVDYYEEGAASADGCRQLVADPWRTKRCHQTVLTVIDRATDAAGLVRRSEILHGKSKIDTVGLRQMLLECLAAFPHVDDKGVVRSLKPIDNSEALESSVRCAGIAVREQRRVGDLLGIIRRRNWRTSKCVMSNTGPLAVMLLRANAVVVSINGMTRSTSTRSRSIYMVRFPYIILLRRLRAVRPTDS